MTRKRLDQKQRGGKGNKISKHVALTKAPSPFLYLRHTISRTLEELNIRTEWHQGSSCWRHNFLFRESVLFPGEWYMLLICTLHVLYV